MADRLDPQYDLFISYAEADRSWAEGYLLDALIQAGIRCTSEAAFHLGHPRLHEFEQAVKASKRVLLVLSPAYFGDPMNAFVDLLATVHGLDQSTWPVVPLVLKPVELPLRLKALVRLDATEPDGWPAVIQTLCEELNRPVAALPSKLPCPYPGMRPFTEQESAVFFGRHQEVDDLLQCLRLHNFLAVIGRSGTGKSSLVFAGLAPALRNSTLSGAGDWLVRSLRPGATPLDTLLSLVKSDGVEPTAAVKLMADTQAAHLLLVIDQFEEVFTLAVESGQASTFQEALRRWINLPECRIVLTVRADFYPDLMTCPLWPQIQAHRYEVLPLGRDGLREAIVRPAERAQVYIEQSLVERLLNDAADEPGMLPLVQETMVLLWEKLQRRFLAVHAYEDIGRSDRTGLQVAMAIRADAAMRDLPSDAHRAIARRIFLRLIQFGEGRPDTGRQQNRSQLRSQGDDPAVFDQTLDHLINARLLVAGESEHQDPPVDIAHERLITGWPTLQQYLTERREAEQIRRRLEDKAQEWVRLGRSSGGLLDSVELREAERWLANSDAAELGRSGDLAALVQASQAAIKRDEQEQKAARQRELAQAQALARAHQQRAEMEHQRAEAQAKYAKTLGRRNRLLIGGGIVAILLAILAVRFAILSDARRIAATARGLLNDNPQLAVLLALASEDMASTDEAAEVISQAREIYPPIAETLLKHTNWVTSVAWSPDGTRLASGSWDHTVIVWDLAGRQPPVTLRGHTGGVESVAWSPDGGRLASGSSDHTVIVWDLAGRQPRVTLRGHTGGVTSVAWHPDGTQLASAGWDHTVIVWDLTRGQPRTTLRGHTRPIRSVAWHPDGTRLASAASDKTIILWDLARGQPEATLKGHPGTGAVLGIGHIRSLAWTPDGAQLTSGASDKTIILWDLARGEPRTILSLTRLLEGYTGEVTSVAWSPDGTQLASGDQEGRVLLVAADFTAHLCRWVLRNLTKAEWKRYLPRYWPYHATCPK